VSYTDAENLLSGGLDGGPMGPVLKTLGSYALLKLLGEGGMGKVYLARHTGMNRLCALKMLPREATQRSSLSRFRTEAQVLANLDHPNIVKVNNFDSAGGEFFLDMEYVDGGDLQQRIESRGRTGLPPGEAKNILMQVLDALVYAHARNVIHRDLKPGNLLLKKNGDIKISDFGLAAVVGEDYQRSLIEKSITLSQVGSMQTLQGSGGSSGSAFAGTLLYMSPQAIAGGKPNVQDDIYAVGVMAYYLLTGRPPNVNYKAASKQRRGLNARWDHFIEKCLEEDVNVRFQDAESARDALERVDRSGKGIYLAAGLACAALAGAAFVLMSDGSAMPASAERSASGTAAAAEPAATASPAVHPLALQANVRQLKASVLNPGPEMQQTSWELTLPATLDLPRRKAPYLIECSLADHQAEVVEWDPSSGQNTLSVTLSRLTEPKPFRISSKPDGADVSINGVFAGKTPLETEIEFRRGSKTDPWPGVDVTIAREGFEQASFVVNYADPKFLPRVDLEPADSEIRIPLPGDLTMRLIRIDPGSFMMGSPPNETGRKLDEEQKAVQIARRFWICATEITQGQYIAITGSNPSNNRFQGANRPVEQLLLKDITGPGGFLDTFNQYLARNGFDGWHAMLPSEAEWEYAARAGSGSAFSNNSNLADNRVDEIAVYAARNTAEVGSRKANPWGLYDMHGNVWEWTREGILRGGSYEEGPANARSASRLRGQAESNNRDRRFGFRIILVRDE